MLSDKLINNLDSLLMESIQRNPRIKFFLKSNKDELSNEGVWEEVEEYIQNAKKLYQDQGLWVNELNYDIEMLNLLHSTLMVSEEDFDKATIFE